jgi:glycosyltransferase involved in cell wall biosynthesis
MQLLASSSHLVDEERFDRLLHAMAQLPDEVTLQIAGDGPARARLELLAAAYGIRDRVEFDSGFSQATDAALVYPSAGNFATAPLQPSRADRPAVGFASGDGLRSVRSMAEFLHALAPGAACRLRRGSDSVLSGHRIALLTNRPTHYRVPLWNRLAERLTEAGASLRVFCTAARPNDRPYMSPADPTFDHVWLRSSRAGPVDVPLDLERRLREFRPTIVLSGGFSPATTGRAAAYAARSAVPFGLWNGDIAGKARASSRVRRKHRHWVVRQASFAICYGSVSADYVNLLEPGLPRVVVRNTAPVPIIAPANGDARGVTVLAVARALPAKRLDLVVDAFRSLQDRDCRLLIVGDGPALPALREQARHLHNVDLLGAVSSDRVGEIYAEADVFAFPSQVDVFGLVLVEALGAGLPTATSSFPGAAGDLAVGSHNCLLVEGEDPDAWRASLTRLVDDAALRRRLGEDARRTIEARWTMEHSVDAWVAGMRLGALVSRGSRA